MHIALIVLAILLVIALVGSAGAKLAKAAPIMEQMSTVGVPPRALPLLAAAEIAGAVGLIVGFLWWPIGVAAAVGVVLYFVGAVIAHLRVQDVKNVAPAALLGVLAAVELGLRLTTHS
ncbi:DoxX family protein [Mycobacterium sp. pR1184]|uniref:DoxX family protein n=1 Tax=Mycobacterium sp. pR1184 TaxID=3238981 RepID=UPI00351ADDA5